jgi:ribulose kinase
MCVSRNVMPSISIVHHLTSVTSKSQELGLLPGTPVGTSLIDAHAGGVGVMESIPDEELRADC